MTLPGSTEDHELEPEPAAARRFGRYELEVELGKGGMGVVWRALDPQLGRRVALKLVKHRGSVVATTRLVREAQAIARLSHPNVVTVHEIGEVGGQVFVAMELIAGTSMRDWLARARHDHDAVLDVFTQAARGLAAAHDAGLVHRDFKPDNVLVGDDGRVRVVDFGLVRLTGGAYAPDDAPPPALAGEAAPDLAPTLLDQALTRIGQVVGTPRYMAPEQLLGEPVDVRADQFSFCVALYEAIARQRPFAARNVDELSMQYLADFVQPIPATVVVPGWLERLLWRGLRRDPAARHPSMHAIVAELEADRGAERRAALDGMARTDPMIAAFPPPAGEGARVERLRAHLEHAWAKKSRGDLAGAGAIAAQLLADTATLAYPPLRAAALYLDGALAHRRGAAADARARLLDAARVAARCGDDWQVANAWVLLVAVATALGRLDEAAAFAEAAEVALERTGDNASLRTRLDNHRGRLATARGELDDAAAWHRAAVARDELTHGHDHPFLVVSLLDLAETLLRAGRLPDAREAALRAAAIAEVDREAPVPSRARCLALLAAIARHDGRTDEAAALDARAATMRARLAR